jgi:hypothetical protein
MKRVGILFLVLLVAVVFHACRERATFPLEPKIEFVSLEKIYNGTKVDKEAVLKIHFTDGDGDIGVDNPDSNTVFDFFVIYYAKRNGEFVTFPFDFKAYLPRFLSSDKPEPLEGDIEYTISIANPLFDAPVIDTVKFECWLADRAGNYSNHIFTSELIVINR